MVDRKISMNRQNVVGLDFEKYNELKPSPEVKRQIQNLIAEYSQSSDATHATEEFCLIAEKNATPRFILAGHIINIAFSQDPSGWQIVCELVLEIFYKQNKLLEVKDLMER